ncbi:MAG: ribosome biogenesis GTPase YlqF [Lachnospiraceae bacterium]|nr:ribosome biogenesis GTPase YlqF [Lachnospiraceae bacterium]MBQ5484681.1 ribosome biogenesis GTPase YlqF [Lachnospiraceae bacterium]MCR4732713.1 ribosome biogenesis GTPase YlqF [Lachnospiraceae bacterium]
MQIQWYPGHMTKALRQIQEDLKLIDLVIELADARIPVSSRNPDIKKLTNGKSHLLILNKADLADPKITAEWQEKLKAEGVLSLALDSRQKKAAKEVSNAVLEATKEKRERDLRRGIKNRPVRALIVGIPNIGKSTLINSLAGRKSAKTGNKPGVTKGKQWIHIGKHLDLLDTPGILWPKFEDEAVGESLAFVGAISDDVVQQEELAILMYHMLPKLVPGRIGEFYEIPEDLEDRVVLSALAKSRNLLKAGAEPDEARAARLLIDDYRSGRLGRITLEGISCPS